jgi:hypothetical protein
MMGLFGSIGKFLGGVVKGVGKVASVASAIAPIPGLGIAGKLAGGLGGVLARGKQIQTRVTSIAPPGLLQKLSPVMPGGSIANQSFYGSGYAGSGAGPGGTRSSAIAISKGISKSARKKGGKMETRYRGGRKIKRRRRYSRSPTLSAAQIRAGFGGKRRMRAARRR